MRHDIEVIMHVTRGVTKAPDLVSDEKLEKLISLFEMVSDAPIYSHWVLTSQMRTDVLDSISNLMLKVFHA